PGMRLGGRRVDPSNARVSMRAAHERGVRHAGNLQVIDVAAAPRDEAWILAPLDRLAEQPLCSGGCHGGSLLPGRRVAGRRLDRLDDVVITRSPAEVALELLPDLPLSRVRLGLRR